MAAEYFTFFQYNPDDPSGLVDVVSLTNGDADDPPFEAAVFRRSEFHLTGEVLKNEITITFAADNEFAKSRMLNRQEDRYWVSISEVKQDATSNAFFVGRMRTANPRAGSIDLVFSNYLAALDIQGLPLELQWPCRHVLYGGLGCRAPRNENPVTKRPNYFDADIAAIDSTNNKIQLSNMPDPLPFEFDKLVFGDVEQAPVVVNIIGTQGTNQLFLSSRYSLSTGRARFNRGCDKQALTCRNDFDNLANFGGFPYISPFEVWGQSIINIGEPTNAFNPESREG